MLSIFSRHLGLLIVWGLIVGATAGVVTFLFPQYYSANSRVLIISRDRSGVDPYTQAKSAERIGENLGEIMQTTDFFAKVMESNERGFDKAYWQRLTPREQRKKWEKNITGNVVFGASLLQITVYDRTPERAIGLSEAVTKTVVSHGWEYVGGDVAIKQVDNPLVSRYPTRPNALINGLVGFVLGVIVAAWWVNKYKAHSLFGTTKF